MSVFKVGDWVRRIDHFTYWAGLEPNKAYKVSCVGLASSQNNLQIIGLKGTNYECTPWYMSKYFVLVEHHPQAMTGFGRFIRKIETKKK